MGITRITATREVCGKLLNKHAVEWYEVQEVMAEAVHPRRGKIVDGEQRYYVIGRTEAGRELRVVFVMIGNDGIRVITAWGTRDKRKG